MKRINLRSGNPGTNDIIKTIIERPMQGINIGEMRLRCRVLDAVSALAPDATSITLEDADYATLERCTQNFQFGVVSRELLAIVDEDLLKPETVTGEVA
jgi:hypothetical protein